MQRDEFLDEAPRYYALAIAAFFARTGANALSRNQILKEYTVELQYDSDGRCLIQSPELWEAATEYLSSRELISIKKAAFGPSLLIRRTNFEDRWNALCEHHNPFDHFDALKEGSLEWLFEALSEVATIYDQLQITSADFQHADAEWTPIKIQPGDPTVANAIEKLSDAVEEIRKDNGYAANFPEERDFVLDGLSKTVGKLNSGTISAGYIRDAWSKLTIVSKRFAGAALELVLTGAKQAIVEFVKSQGGELLRILMHLFR